MVLFYEGTTLYTWHMEEFKHFLHEKELHYGLHLIAEKEIVSIEIEYTNIIWNYQIYFGSYKKRYHALAQDDERWEQIEKGLIEDLKAMELESLKDEVLAHLKQNQYLVYQNKVDEQFKKYCI